MNKADAFWKRAKPGAAIKVKSGSDIYGCVKTVEVIPNTSRLLANTVFVTIIDLSGHMFTKSAKALFNDNLIHTQEKRYTEQTKHLLLLNAIESMG